MCFDAGACNCITHSSPRKNNLRTYSIWSQVGQREPVPDSQCTLTWSQPSPSDATTHNMFSPYLIPKSPLLPYDSSLNRCWLRTTRAASRIALGFFFTFHPLTCPTWSRATRHPSALGIAPPNHRYLPQFGRNRYIATSRDEARRYAIGDTVYETGRSVANSSSIHPPVPAQAVGGAARQACPFFSCASALLMPTHPKMIMTTPSRTKPSAVDTTQPPKAIVKKPTQHT